jgi:tight adherence protein B
MLDSPWLFLVLVFLAVFLLVQALVVPVFSESARMRKRLIARLSSVNSIGTGDFARLLREKHLSELSPLERRLEALPSMARLARVIEQSGRSTPVYRLLALSGALAGVGALAAWTMTRATGWTLMLALAGSALPLLKVLRDRARRMARFEEQLPDALDVVKRALKAGHPFSQALNLVVEDMEDPIRKEFDLLFSEINYGGDMRNALLGLLERVPSVSVMALVTAVLVQRETGGNLAETFERITGVIRGRFKLYRRVRTLSAEGRLSAWILALVPVTLFVVISVTSPGYLPVMLHDPLGKNMVAAAVVMAIVGVLWIRRILRIQV